MTDPIKRLWLVTVERTLTAKVLAWAETKEDAKDAVNADSPLDEYGFEPETGECSWAEPAVMPNGKIAFHHLGDGDAVYGDQDGRDLSVADAIAMAKGHTEELPEHLARLVTQRKELNNGQLPLIEIP